jgi:hypothetical protein
MWSDDASGWAKCGACDRTFRIREPGESVPAAPAAPEPLPPTSRAAPGGPPPPLPPRPDTIVGDEPPRSEASYRDAPQVARAIRELRIGRRFSVGTALFGTSLLLTCGVLPLVGYMTGSLHGEDGAQASLILLVPFLACGAFGGVLVVDAVRRAMWNTRIVLGPERVEIDDGGYRAPVKLEQLRAVSVEVTVWTSRRAFECVVVADDASGKRLVVTGSLSPAEADHLGALLADHFALARPTLVRDLPPPPPSD